MRRQRGEYTSVIRPSASWIRECQCWLIDRKGMAEFLGVTPTKIGNLHLTGRLPHPVRFRFGPPRYCVPELRDWLRMGCPPTREWIEIRGLSGSTPLDQSGFLAPHRFEGEPSRAPGLCVEVRD